MKTYPLQNRVTKGYSNLSEALEELVVHVAKKLGKEICLKEGTDASGARYPTTLVAYNAFYDKHENIEKALSEMLNQAYSLGYYEGKEEVQANLKSILGLED